VKQTMGAGVRALILLVFLAAGCKGFQKDAMPQELAQDCGDIDLDAAQAIARRDDRSTTRDLQCALAYLRDRMVQGVPESVTAAKLSYLLADRLGDPTREDKLASEGMRWAEHALDLSADLYKEHAASAHYFLAVNLGLAVRGTVVLALKNISRIKAELEAARKLDPNLEWAGPSRVLGLLYVKAPSWPKGFGDTDKGLELLVDSVSRFPNYPGNRILYARGLADADADENREVIRQQVEAARKLLDGGTWGPEAATRWRKDIAQIAKDAGL